MSRTVMLRLGIMLLTIGSLALWVASSAGAQENLERGKTLYESECARCHKSPQSVTTFHGGVDLETFLGEQHYAATPESAASIAAYLKGLERKQIPRRRPKQRSEANPSQPKPSVSKEDEPLADPVQQALKMLFGRPESN